MRRLASLDVSFGSIQNEDGDRRIGLSLKLNLLNGKDPLLAKDLYNDITEKYKREIADLEEELNLLATKLRAIQGILEIPALRDQIDSTKTLLSRIYGQRREEINSRAKKYILENWNASSLDVAVGRVNTYQTDSSGALKDLRLNRNTAWGWEKAFCSPACFVTVLTASRSILW